jgi:hypothetical protein
MSIGSPVGIRLKITAILATLSLWGCGGGPPLDYQTAMDLLRDHSLEPVKVTFSGTRPSGPQDVRITRAFQDLIDAHILLCESNGSSSAICSPGPAGDGVESAGPAELSVVAGRWVPSTVTAIDRTGRNSATAEARMQFEPSDVYQGMQAAFDALQTPESVATAGDRKQGKVVHASFRRYEDGWHLEDAH